MTGTLIVNARTWDAQNKALRDYEDRIKQLQAENKFLKLNARRICTCGFPLEDKVDLLDRIVELKEELAKAQPVLDAAMKYAKTPAGVSRESLRAKALAADRMFKAARAMEEV